jgi:serine/threonine protein kinase
MNNLESGKELGRYELLLPIAKGGMAEVWAARLLGSRGFTKLVAIKVISPGSMDGARLEQMFLEEASLAALIHHPHVVETLELGEHEGTLYLVMEWVEGESLNYVQSRAEERGGLPLLVAVHLLGQACKGLHAAHELTGENGTPLEIVHRDISPQNILVTYSGSAKIVDFGIAKATGRASTLTEAGEIKGKVAYMSPEQVKGEQLDRRSDLFALGILLFWLTTGTHPFKGSNPAETVRRIVLGEIVARPTELVPGYPAKLEAVVLKALANEVSERWNSAQEIVLALAHALPDCFDSNAENEVKRYLQELLGERAKERRAAVRLAREMLGGRTPQTFSSLSAISLDRSSERSSSQKSRPVLPSTSSMDPVVPLPWAKAKRPWLLALGGGVALLGVVGLGLIFGAAREQGSAHSAASPVVPTAPSSPAAPRGASEETALPAAPSPNASASSSSEPAASADEKRKRAASSRVAGSKVQPARSASTTSSTASARPVAAKPSRDAWDPNNFGSRH